MVEKKKPIRTCVCCRREFTKNELMRVVATKDGKVFLDESKKANGRGAYICGEESCMKKLAKSKALDRALKTPISSEVYALIADGIAAAKK